MPPGQGAGVPHNGAEQDAAAWAYWMASAGLHAGPDEAHGTGEEGPAGGDVPPHGHASAGGDGATLRPVPLADIEDTPAPSPLAGFLHPEPGAITVLHGDGGVGKGTLASLWAAQVSRYGPVLILDAEGHPKEWRRRVGGLQGALEQVFHVAHPGGRIEPQGLHGVALVIVDSAAYFTPKGADLWSPEAATALQAAAAVSGCPWLVLAHHSKGGAPDKAYGSVFWHNAPRVAYGYVVDEQGQHVLTCHKATDVEGLEKGTAWTVDVTYEPGHIPVEVAIEPWHGDGHSPEAMLVEYLKGGWRSKQQVMDHLGIGARTAQRMLNHTLGLETMQPDAHGPKLWRVA